MSLGNLAAYGGLLNTENKVEAGNRNMASLERLNNYVDTRRKESMMMQELEAQEYEKIRKEASTLLERDREKVNKKAIDIQLQIKEQIQKFGSRDKFMAAGGVSILKKAATNLLYSDETNMYRDNQKNLERIFQIQAAGKGNLISKRNMRSLVGYRDGNSDKIEFDGLLTEVDIPQDEHFFGEEIPVENILRHKDNWLKIYNNMILEDPTLKGIPPGPELDNLMWAFTKENYGGLGKDKTKLEYEKSLKLMEAQRKAALKSGTDEEKEEAEQLTYFTQASNLMSNAAKYVPMTMDKILMDGKGNEVNYWDELRKSDNNVDLLFGSGQSGKFLDWHRETFIPGTSIAEDVNNISKFFSRDNFKPASAMVLPKEITNDLNKGLFQESYDPATKSVSMKIATDGSFYSTDGRRITKKIIHESATEEAKGFEVGQSFFGFVDGNDNLITQAVDKKGNVDVERNKKRQAKVYNGTEARPQMFTVLKDEDGEVYYYKTDVTSAAQLSALQGIVGPKGNLAPVKKEMTQSQKKLEQNEAFIMSQKANVQKSFNEASAPGSAFDSQSFYQESKKFTTDTGDRNKVIKSFYAALSVYDDKKNPDLNKFSASNLKRKNVVPTMLFSKQVQMFDKLKELAVDTKGTSDETFIDKYAEIVSDENAEDLEFNKEFVSIWKSYYKTLK